MSLPNISDIGAREYLREDPSGLKQCIPSWEITSKIPALNATFIQLQPKMTPMNNTSNVILGMATCMVLAILLAGCTGLQQPGPSAPQETPTPLPAVSLPSASSDTVVDANNQFALGLYSRLANDPEFGDGNLFFSPISLSSALAITYEGARGSTADEIRSVFHFPENQSALRSGFEETIARINSNANDYTLRMANAMWAEKTHPFLPDYIRIADRYYGAKTTNLDFIHVPDECRITINRWVENQTEDRIRDLIPAGVINSNTCLVITNAIYFKGTWVKQVDPEKTVDADFLTGRGITVRVPMMERTDEAAIYGYAETDTLQVLEMPYESGNGTEITMLVLLPRGDDLEELEQLLDAGMLKELRDSVQYRQVKVHFPRFTMETKYFLPRVLSAMGMPLAFTGAADFSGMDGSGDLFITDVIHQAFVEVNEEGTEAAAATAVIMGKGAAPREDEVPVFRADHPFIFIIQDGGTGNILFMGRVSDPVGT